MNEQQALPTPYDIVHPTSPPITIGLEAFIILTALILLAALFLYLYARQRKPQAISHSAVSPIITELRTLLQRYEETRERSLLHLFVKSVKRHEETGHPELEKHLALIEAERFAPSLSENVISEMKEVLSQLAYKGGES